jgi:GTP-binding protein HflX
MVLSELDMAKKPVLKVYNKWDSAERYVRDPLDGVAISALKGTGLNELMERVDSLLSHGFKHAHLKLPHTAGRTLSELYRVGRVVSAKHTKTGITVDADLPEKLFGRYRKYCV